MASLLACCRSFAESSQTWNFSSESLPEEEKEIVWELHSHGLLAYLLMAKEVDYKPMLK